MQSKNLSLTARWERDVIELEGGTTALVVQITSTEREPAASRSPLDLAFVIDRSGSMAGEKLELAKTSVERAIGQLSGQDRATLVAFDHEVWVMSTLQPVTSDYRRTLRQHLQTLESRGSTNLSDGWLTGCQQLAIATTDTRPIRLQRSLLLTDGLANEGVTDPVQLANHAAELRSRGISTTTLGLGAGFDESLLSAMAEAGGGNFQYIASPGDLPAFFERELGELLATTATGVELSITTPEKMRAWLVSTFRNQRLGRTRTIGIGDIPSGDELILVFDIKTISTAKGEAFPGSLELTWCDPESGQQQQLLVPFPPLHAATEQAMLASEPDLFVAEQAALQRAAQQQRQAMELDRRGRYQESRLVHSAARDYLAAAPETVLTRRRLAEAEDLAAYDNTQAFSESERKRTEWAGFNRGRRQRGEQPDS